MTDIANNNDNVDKFILYCEKGKYKKLVELIEYGFKLSELDEYGKEYIDIGITKLLIAQYICEGKGLKGARINRCLEYMLNRDLDYSKCHMSFFTATSMTLNIECSKKLIANGFNVNSEYNNSDDFLEHLLITNANLYGVYKRNTRKYPFKKCIKTSFEFLLSNKDTSFENCSDSLIILAKYNNPILKEMLKKNIDINKEKENSILIDHILKELILNKNKKMIEQLKLKNGKFNLCKESFNIALSNKNKKIIDFLIKEGYDIEDLSEEKKELLNLIQQNK